MKKQVIRKNSLADVLRSTVIVLAAIILVSLPSAIEALLGGI